MLTRSQSENKHRNDLRRDFPVLQQHVNGYLLTYLDNAATTQKPHTVIKAISRFYECDNAIVHRGVHTLGNRATESFEAARKRAADFINARSPAEIIFTRGTTEGINLVAEAWGGRVLGPGDKILLTEMEHHSNIVPWQMLARRVGAEVLYVPVIGDEGLLDMGCLNGMLAQPVKLFAFAHVSNLLGTINPVSDLCALARAHGITTLVDAAQSAGHMPLDVQDLGCDFLTFSGHKMCGPTGIGVLYGRHELLAAMPPWHGGGEMIRDVDFAETIYADPPYKFEAGTPDIAGAIGLHAAMDYLETIGLAQIFRHDQEVAAYAFEKLASVEGIRLLGPRAARAGVIAFTLSDVHAHDLVLFADEYGVALRGGHHCAQPLTKRLKLTPTIRASFYFYNTLEETDRLVDIIHKARKVLAAS